MCAPDARSKAAFPSHRPVDDRIPAIPPALRPALYDNKVLISCYAGGILSQKTPPLPGWKERLRRDVRWIHCGGVASSQDQSSLSW
jgi:hypothetical protein